jgi:hypothetical protein
LELGVLLLLNQLLPLDDELRGGPGNVLVGVGPQLADEDTCARGLEFLRQVCVLGEEIQEQEQDKEGQAVLGEDSDGEQR